MESTQAHLEKYIVRQVVKRNSLVTDEVLGRQKQVSPMIRSDADTRETDLLSGPTQHRMNFSPNGPLHQLIERLVTPENVERLGFVPWTAAQTMLRNAFDTTQSAFSFRALLQVAQLVVLGQRFCVPPMPEPSNY